MKRNFRRNALQLEANDFNSEPKPVAVIPADDKKTGRMLHRLALAPRFVYDSRNIRQPDARVSLGASGRKLARIQDLYGQKTEQAESPPAARLR
jgi:hypothetical protein